MLFLLLLLLLLLSFSSLTSLQWWVLFNYFRQYVCTWVRVCVCACLVSLQKSMHMEIGMSTTTNLSTSLHTCIHTLIHAYIHTYVTICRLWKSLLKNAQNEEKKINLTDWLFILRVIRSLKEKNRNPSKRERENIWKLFAVTSRFV